MGTLPSQVMIHGTSGIAPLWARCIPRSRSRGRGSISTGVPLSDFAGAVAGPAAVRTVASRHGVGPDVLRCPMPHELKAAPVLNERLDIADDPEKNTVPLERATAWGAAERVATAAENSSIPRGRGSRKDWPSARVVRHKTGSAGRRSGGSRQSLRPRGIGATRWARSPSARQEPDDILDVSDSAIGRSGWTRSAHEVFVDPLVHGAGYHRARRLFA
jgi:hypothetical protein